MMRNLFFFSFFIFLSCGTQKIADYKQDSVVIDSTLGDGGLDEMIQPYRESMVEEMSEVIGVATKDLIKYNPESPLSNFTAEAAFLAGIDYSKSNADLSGLSAENTFAMLNFGGLRAPIHQGDITVGEIFELMPFDNTLVIVKISGDKVRMLARYIFDKLGQPVYNANFLLTPDIETMKIGGVEYNFDKELYVITTDYLSSGGDNMTFFNEPLGIWDTGILLRDVFIQYVKEKKELGGFELTGKIQINN
ncbi:MAG: 5'-nucleotidase C-terminal domain-containing protein [Crocinitomicaceae bacterium]|nr:5'-nucleotidase C-terminal domain-containing protein [Crocinitomicaceae bacterium]